MHIEENPEGMNLWDCARESIDRRRNPGDERRNSRVFTMMLLQ
jgi:hypothetical protein